MDKSQVSIVKCRDYNRDEVYNAVLKSIELLGGVGAFFRKGKKILVKPNLLMAKSPDEHAICTHPEFIRAVVKILKENDLKVLIGDGPAVWGGHALNLEKVYTETGVFDIAKEEGVDFIYFNKNKWYGKFPLCCVLDEVDYVVSLPKFKTHSLTILTGGVKNLFGLVGSNYKTKLHRDYFELNDFSSMLVDVYEKVKPVLTLVDGIMAQEGDGPGTGGIKKHLGLIFASPDAIAIDSVLSVILGLKPQDVPTNRIAFERGLGEIRMDKINFPGETLFSLEIPDFKLATTSIMRKIPKAVFNIIRNLIVFKPEILEKKCKKCMTCIKACPESAIGYNENKTRLEIDYKKCIKCFCCHEACPYAAIEIEKSFLAKLLGM